MAEPDEIEIECWWETATTILDLDADALDALGAEPRAVSNETDSAHAEPVEAFSR